MERPRLNYNALVNALRESQRTKRQPEFHYVKDYEAGTVRAHFLDRSRYTGSVCLELRAMRGVGRPPAVPRRLRMNERNVYDQAFVHSRR